MDAADVEVLARASDAAQRYLAGLSDRPVGATASYEELTARLPRSLPTTGLGAGDVVDELIGATEGGLVATGSPRYFGFVIGGAMPAAVAADWLTSTWDQNAGLYVGGPAASVIEETAARWILEALDLPASASVGLVTGCQMAHVTALAAARHRVLADRGWDVERDGLAGAPAIRVLAGALNHITVARALRLLGLGTSALEVVAVDDANRMQPAALAAMLDDDDRPTIVCAQLGEVNSGAMDPVDAIADATEAAGAWLHIDGAFGLWARASREHGHLAAGAERADSWATDAHKWLNVPYDCGVAICAHRDDHRLAMGAAAAYLEQAEGDTRRDALDWNPEFSRRARGTTVYAALRSLGRDGLEALVDRCCAMARRFAVGLEAIDGAEVLEPCVLNQVLVAFGDDARTARVIDAVQAGGVCWMSGTTWRDRTAMRVSVINWQTGPDDVDRSLAAVAAALAGADAG